MKWELKIHAWNPLAVPVWYAPEEEKWKTAAFRWMKLQNGCKCGHTWRLLTVGKNWEGRFVTCERVDWSLCGPLRIGKVNCSNLAGENSQLKGWETYSHVVLSLLMVMSKGNVRGWHSSTVGKWPTKTTLGISVWLDFVLSLVLSLCLREENIHVQALLHVSKKSDCYQNQAEAV